MDEPPSPNRDRANLLAALAAATYARLVDEVIARVRALPDDSRQSGNPALADVWEEFKDQVHGEQSSSFRYYEDTIAGFCAEAVSALPREVQQLLWLWTEGYERLWVDRDTVQLADFVPPDVADELYRRVCNAAG